MNTETIIVKKRDGEELTEAEIRFIIDGLLSGEVADYQMAAFLMAIYFRGMNYQENYFLTKVMIESGEQVDLSHLNRVAVDKHSTGGVGDKVSIVLAPLMAAAGLNIPMISGRALGHSGGTLDKLESIPGFKTNLSLKAFVQQIEKIHVSMIGQTKEIAPADKQIYALRDRTGTVPSIPLVVGSILSKKIAEGAQVLVIDLKLGEGAFFKSYSQALRLGERLITISDKFNIKTSVLITSMDQPLGYAVGNSVEIKEAINTLQGKGPQDLIDVTIALGAEMLVRANLEKEMSSASNKVSKLLSSGAGFEKFITLVEAQGGDISVIKNPDHFPKSGQSIDITSPNKGHIQKIDAYKIGMLSMEMGAGRKKMSDAVDHRTGIVLERKEGDEIEKGTPVAKLYLKSNADAEYFKNKFFDAVKISEDKPNKRQLILRHLTIDDLPINDA